MEEERENADLSPQASARAAEKWRGSGTEAVAGGKTMQVREGGKAPPPARRATARTRDGTVLEHRSLERKRPRKNGRRLEGASGLSRVDSRTRA